MPMSTKFDNFVPHFFNNVLYIRFGASSYLNGDKRVLFFPKIFAQDIACRVQEKKIPWNDYIFFLV